ncbi:MAG: hypothetical protein NTAFB01_20340 [Nitrospira sp.]
MTRKRNQLLDVRRYCQELHEDDGVDPRRYFHSSLGHERSRKNLQLCGQVAKLLNEALVGRDNPTLASLFVIAVVPAPTLNRLEVVLDATHVPSSVASDAIYAQLARSHQSLRMAVGEGINRKYVPELTFRLAAPYEVPR